MLQQLNLQCYMAVKHGQSKCKWNHPSNHRSRTLSEINGRIKFQMAGESELTMNYNLRAASKKNRMDWSSGRNIWWYDCKGSTSEETWWKKKSGKTKINLVKLLWGASKIDGRQGMEAESGRQNCMGYHSKGGMG